MTKNFYRRSHEKPIYRRNCLKRGAWTVCRFKTWLGEKRDVFERGIDTPMHTMSGMDGVVM